MAGRARIFGAHKIWYGWHQLYIRLTPTPNPSPIIKSPVNGSLANNKKAASPIVAVNVAKTEPKLKRPDTYLVTTMIAPPQPGNAPSAAARDLPFT